MRLLFAGTPQAAAPSLTALLTSGRHDVVAVLTRPPARSGRGRTLQDSPIAELAQQSGIPVFAPAKPGDPDFVSELAALQVDCAPVVAYGALLREPPLGIPRLGWVNLHFSLLPAWRGAAPVQHAVLHGDQLTGAATFQIGPGLDDGPVFGVITEPIHPRDTSGELLERLATAGAALLLATLDGLADGTLRPQPQPADGVSLAPKLTADDARVRLTDPAFAVDRRIRACTPAPGAWLQFRGDRVKLGPVLPATDGPALAPGALRVGETEKAVYVGTATHPVTLGWVQPAGKRPQPAMDWARGARLTVDDRLD